MNQNPPSIDLTDEQREAAEYLYERDTAASSLAYVLIQLDRGGTSSNESTSRSSKKRAI